MSDVFSDDGDLQYFHRCRRGGGRGELVPPALEAARGENSCTIRQNGFRRIRGMLKLKSGNICIMYDGFTCKKL